MLGQLTAAAFVPHQDAGWVIIHDGETSLPLTLVEVVALPERPASPRPNPFSLTFLGPSDPILAQGTYAFEHAGFDRLTLFVVPVGRADDGRVRYEVIFN
jgi:hypothetical protein